MKNNLAGCIFLCMVLTGCQTFHPKMRSFTEPVQGPTARLRAVTDGVAIVGDPKPCDPPGRTAMDEFPDGVIVAGGFGLPNHGYLNRSLGMPLPIDNERTYWGEVHIAANRPFHLSYSWEGNGVACGVGGSFIPKEGRDYETVAETNSKGCSLGVSEITNGNRQPVMLVRGINALCSK